jgi:hypothetical protein
MMESSRFGTAPVFTLPTPSSRRVQLVRRGQAILQTAVERLLAPGLTQAEIRRLAGSEMSAAQLEKQK